ncbi:2Fe-2S iron-sulfur cluster-binding protein [Bacteriovoracaceae bacterium]|nr:2Fe-2S iron-sulfur cluster-binding protein [Bacteriovoracaceae bacterium]
MPTVSLMKTNLNGESTDETEFEVSATEGSTIYDEVDNGGQELPHGCLAGSCGSCRILVIEGEEHLSSPSAIEKDTLSHIEKTYKENFGDEFLAGKTIRLSCRAKIMQDGNVKIAKLK